MLMRRVLITILITLSLAPAAAAGPRVQHCQNHHPWQRVGQRQKLVWCVAHALNSPGSPRTAVSVGHCESGSDLQDTYGGDGYVGTFQHATPSWHSRWQRWGSGVPSSATNVLSQAVVSVRMARYLGTWNSSAGWAGCA